MDVLLGGLISLAIGLGLWAFLPRGVVLTRELCVRTPAGEPQYQTWQIRNASPLPVRIARVTYSGVNAYNPISEKIEERDLPGWVPHEEEASLGIRLHFDDEVLEMTRDDGHKDTWRGHVVPPGDTLTAFVNLNRTLSIRYRRGGLLGFAERRTLRSNGGV